MTDRVDGASTLLEQHFRVLGLEPGSTDVKQGRVAVKKPCLPCRNIIEEDSPVSGRYNEWFDGPCIIQCNWDILLPWYKRHAKIGYFRKTKGNVPNANKRRLARKLASWADLVIGLSRTLELSVKSLDVH
jgi:hypothetical protein